MFLPVLPDIQKQLKAPCLPSTSSQIILHQFCVVVSLHMSICLRIINSSNLLVAVKLPHTSCLVPLTLFNRIIAIRSGVKLVRPIPKPLWLLRHIIRCYRLVGRSQSPHGLRRGSPAARLLGFRFRIPPGSWMYASCKCCVLSATGRSHAQRIPNECGVSECDLETSTMRRTRSTRAVKPRRTGFYPVMGTKPRKGRTLCRQIRIWYGNPLLLPPKFRTLENFLAKRRVAVYSNKISEIKSNDTLGTHNYQAAITLLLCQYYHTIW